MKIDNFTLITTNKANNLRFETVFSINDKISIDKKKNRYMVKISPCEGYYIYNPADIYSKCIEMSKPYKSIDDIKCYEYISFEEYDKRLFEYEEELRRKREEEEKKRAEEEENNSRKILEENKDITEEIMK